MIKRIPTISLVGLKKALNIGNATEEYPIGTEIPDTWNGQSNPLIVAQYTNITLTDSTAKPGAYLVRKYVEPLVHTFGDDADYTHSAIRYYLRNEYIENCSAAAKQVIVASTVTMNSGNAVYDRFFLMSSTNVLAVYANREGEPWEYYKQKTGLSGNGTLGYSPSANNGRIMKTRGGEARSVWLRTRDGSSGPNLRYIKVDGSVPVLGYTQYAGILAACAVTAD